LSGSVFKVMGRTSRSLGPVALGLLLLVACRDGSAGGAGGPSAGLPRGTLLIHTDAGSVKVRVEIAESPEAQQRGLMGRTELAPDAGMVFLEPRPVRVGFWMKDTLIPLSIAFWGHDQRILAILDMAPCEQEPCPTYDPGVAWTGAVEVNQGFFEDRGVEVGDPVRLDR
jgi:uncharacterized membrane protein (UPF0127 family)